jgi:hypothetical protein
MHAAAKQFESLTFKSAGWFRDNMHVSQSTLLFLLATGRLHVRQTATYPLFCVEDVKAYYTKGNLHNDRRRLASPLEASAK